MQLERDPNGTHVVSVHVVKSVNSFDDVRMRVAITQKTHSGLKEITTNLTPREVDDLCVMLQYYKKVALGEIKEGETND